MMRPVLLAVLLLQCCPLALCAAAWQSSLPEGVVRNTTLRGGQPSPRSMSPRSSPMVSPPRSPKGELRGEDAASATQRRADAAAAAASLASAAAGHGGPPLPERDVSAVEIWAKWVETGVDNQSRVTNFTFPARRSTTIRTVKEKLADFTGHAATHQRVLARGFELNNIDRVGSRTALDVVPHSPPRPHNILTGQGDSLSGHTKTVDFSRKGEREKRDVGVPRSLSETLLEAEEMAKATEVLFGAGGEAAGGLLQGFREGCGIGSLGNIGAGGGGGGGTSKMTKTSGPSLGGEGVQDVEAWQVPDKSRGVLERSTSDDSLYDKQADWLLGAILGARSGALSPGTRVSPPSAVQHAEAADTHEAIKAGAELFEAAAKSFRGQREALSHSNMMEGGGAGQEREEEREEKMEAESPFHSSPSPPM